MWLVTQIHIAEENHYVSKQIHIAEENHYVSKQIHINQGPVVQSIVSLMSLLKVHS